MERTLLLPTLLLALSISGCASPRGSTWAVADFNKYDKNYASFPTHKIQIGKSKFELVKLFGTSFNIVEAGKGYEVLAYEKWASVTGPDYIEQTLYLSFVENRLEKWKITNDTMQVVPRSW